MAWTYVDGVIRDTSRNDLQKIEYEKNAFATLESEQGVFRL